MEQTGNEAYTRGDYETALRELRALAEQGRATDQFNLGQMYRDGVVCPQDYQEAARWFRLAAEQGEVAAQKKLAEIYATGVGVPRDLIQAYMWMAVAEAQREGGWLSRKLNMRMVHRSQKKDLIAKQMTPAQITEANSLAQERQSTFEASAPSVEWVDKGVKWVDKSKLGFGPIQHETLTEEQLARIRRFHETFSEVERRSFDDEVDLFKRDMYPDLELDIWERMARAYQTYCDGRQLSLEAKKEVYNILSIRSLMSEKDVLAQLKLNLLTQAEALEVMRGI